MSTAASSALYDIERVEREGDTVLFPEEIPMMFNKAEYKRTLPTELMGTTLSQIIEEIEAASWNIRMFVERQSINVEIDMLLSLLETTGVKLINPSQIIDYLLEFPDLINIIPQAVEATRNHLPGAYLFLGVYSDPEIEDRYLSLCVRLRKYDETVMERIEAAEAEFLDRLVDKEGWLQLTTDFEDPEERGVF